jgi:hypothetical protein
MTIKRKGLGLINLMLAAIWLPSLNLISDQTEIRTTNGVQIVSNSKKPAPPKGVPTKLRLEPELSFGESSVLEEMFSEIISVAVDSEENVFILDTKEAQVKVFDRSAKLIRTFGKKGQGPGEFSRPVGIFLSPNNEVYIEDNLNRRLAIFTREGNFVRNISAPRSPGPVNFIMDSRGNLIGMEVAMAGNDVSRQIKKYTPELNPLLVFESTEIKNPLIYGINIFESMILYKTDARDRLYLGSSKDYEFKVYAPDGTLILRILKAYDPVENPQAKKEEKQLEVLDRNIKLKFETSKYYPPYFYFTIDEEGRLIVQSTRKNKAEKKMLFDVFDAEGRYVAEIPLNVMPFLWKNKKLYAIEETEDGYSMLKRYRVYWER